MPMKKRKPGRAARDKGSRAERKVRDMLRSIYPQVLRERVYRVPLSGGGAIKCDVFDGNDPDSAYEVKCQETLVLNEWWRQAKSQAGATRTPVLVVTKNYYPFYFIMREEDWEATRQSTIFYEDDDRIKLSTQKFMDRCAVLSFPNVGEIVLDDDVCCVISQDFYLKVKAGQAEERFSIIKEESS